METRWSFSHGHAVSFFLLVGLRLAFSLAVFKDCVEAQPVVNRLLVKGRIVG